MNVPIKNQPTGDFFIKMTTKVNCIKKISFKIDATDFLINWGDDSRSFETAHEYDIEGCYTICIKGLGLKKLDVRGCFLTSLDLDAAPDLMNLCCSHNPLKVLDLSKLKDLQILDCYGAELEKLDVRNCGNIKRLNCGNNRITELYTTDCINLKVLLCNGNRLKSLSVQGCEHLEWMNCSDNLFNGEELNIFCESLPSLTNHKGGHICIGGNEGTRSCDIPKFNIKCWNVDDFRASRGC